jgi:hypothetical protein
VVGRGASAAAGRTPGTSMSGTALPHGRAD